VGAVALTPEPPASDAALTHPLPALDADELPTAHNVPAVSPTDAERILSDRPPAVAGALSPRAPGAGIKTPPLSGDMFRGLPRAAGRPLETETKTRAGVAPQPGMASKGRSTLLLDGSAPPSFLFDPSSDGPPIVVPASGTTPPKAVTQPPPWGEGAAHAASAIPSVALPMRAREPSVEEISASMLLPPDASSDFAVPATEELSGSLLVEDVPGVGPAAAAPAPAPSPAPATRAPSIKPPVPPSVSPRPPSVKPPLPTSSSSRPPSVKPPVPHSASARPAAHAQRTLLGMPDLPRATPAPNLEALRGTGSVPPPLPVATIAPPALAEPVSHAPPAVILAPSLVAEMQPIPDAAAFPAMQPSFEPPAAPPTQPLLPLPHDAGGQGSYGPPSAGPMTGDIELTRLPRSAPDKVLDAVRRALRSGSRPPWFLPAVAAAGLLVGIGLVGLMVGVVRGASHADKGEPTSASPRASGTSSSRLAPAPSAAVVPSEAPVPAPASPLAPCTVVGTTHVLGPSATVAAGVEATVTGDDLALGFAPDDHSAMAIRVDPSQLSVTTTAHGKSRDAIRRVTPLLAKGGLSLVIDTDHKGDRLAGRRTVRSVPPVQIGATADGQLSWAKLGGGPAGALWPFGGGGNASLDALRGAVDGSGDPTLAIAFRSGGAVWTGTIGGTGGLAPVGPLSHVDGLGTTIGSPAIAISSSVAMVAWADRASNDAPWKLRWTRFSAGSAPEAPADFVPPDGGKGGPFMSPALATVPGGRFLLVWTEGPASAHAVRAQTLALDGTRIGAPLELSPDETNAGQAQAAIGVGGNGVVAFLQSAGKGFAVAATAIRCGTP
jgi:hypothetical protein